MVKTENNTGFVTQIIGRVLDIVFPQGTLPAKIGRASCRERV